MIIQCQACRTRFKLDESRIKGKGARIRCRKCGESIIVMKSDILPTPPPPPKEKGIIDLRTTLNEPGSTAAPRSQPDEVDVAFDRIFATEPETGTVPPREEEATATPEERIGPPPYPAAEERPPDHAPADSPFLREPEGEKEFFPPKGAGDIPSMRTEDRGIEELFGTTPPTEERTESARKRWTPPELVEEAPEDRRAEGISAPPSRPLDISGQLSSEPLRTGKKEVPTAPRAPERREPFEGSSSPRMEAIQEELAELAEKRHRQEESRRPAPSPPRVPTPEPPPTEPPPPRIVEIERPPAARPRTPAPSRRLSAPLLVLLLIFLAGAGVYSTYTEQGQEALRTVLSAVAPYWPGGKASDRSFKVENLSGFYATGSKAGRMFVVHGKIINEGPEKRSGIRVRAELLDGTRNTIAEKTVYAGNILPDLSSVDRDQIETAMANRFGEKLSNIDVAKGHTVPFMVVFPDPPEGIEEFRVEALKGD